MEHQSPPDARSITPDERSRIQREVLDMIGSAEFRIFIRSVVRNEIESLGVDTDRYPAYVCA
jgi:hypothetical protein